MYLDYAELQAERRQPLYMKDWREKLDAFLKFNDRQILEHPEKVSMEVAARLALEQYDKFDADRLSREAALPDENFDRMAKQLERNAEEKFKRKKKGED